MQCERRGAPVVPEKPFAIYLVAAVNVLVVIIVVTLPTRESEQPVAGVVALVDFGSLGTVLVAVRLAMALALLRRLGLWHGDAQNFRTRRAHSARRRVPWRPS